jgi:hypothetical protein
MAELPSGRNTPAAGIAPGRRVLRRESGMRGPRWFAAGRVVSAARRSDRLIDLLYVRFRARMHVEVLSALHAVRLRQRRHLKPTDYHDGRLHLPSHVVVLAEPVRQRLTAYLDYRQHMWPASTNPHLFVHVRSWSHHRPVWPN